MHSMFPLFCNFRNGKSYKIRGTLQNKGTQNKGPPTVGDTHQKILISLRIIYNIIHHTYKIVHINNLLIESPGNFKLRKLKRINTDIIELARMRVINIETL